MNSKLEESFVEYSGVLDRSDIGMAHVYRVVLKESKNCVGTIFISDDKDRALSFEFNDDRYVVDACGEVLRLIINEDVPYVTFSTKIMDSDLKSKLRELGMRYKYSYRSDDDYRMYQYSLNTFGTYTGYWDKYKHYIESSELR